MSVSRIPHVIRTMHTADHLASNLKVVLGTAELGKRGLMKDQPVSVVYAGH